MGSETARIPKPMIGVGNRPILWHIMSYFLSYGHSDFILCLGHKGEAIKDFFLNFDEALMSDFTLRLEGREVRTELISQHSHSLNITFVETGIHTSIGERLLAVQQFIDEPEFLATYGDGLTDAPLDEMIAEFRRSETLVQFLSVRPEYNAHLVISDDAGRVLALEDMSRSSVRINGGFFVMKREVLDRIEPGEDLVDGTLTRLIAERAVTAYPYEGFFGPMDTIKDRQRLESLFESGRAPWPFAG